jgi:hypothetical protein
MRSLYVTIALLLCVARPVSERHQEEKAISGIEARSIVLM